MLKLLYKPVAIVAGIVGGLLSGLIFNRVWKIVGRGSDARAPGLGARLGGDLAGRRPAERNIRAGQDGCRSRRRRVDAQENRNLAGRYPPATWQHEILPLTAATFPAEVAMVFISAISPRADGAASRRRRGHLVGAPTALSL